MRTLVGPATPRRELVGPPPTRRGSDTNAAAKSSVRHDAAGISSSDRAIIHLARALITSPHLLLLHRPLSAVDEEVADRILDVLRDFVDQRGLALDGPPETRLLRTAIFTCR